MTPFWNETSPSNLYAAAMGILNCAQTLCGDEELRWKIGLDVRRAIYLQAKTVSGPTQEHLAWREKHNTERDPNFMQFCGLPGDVQGLEFPHDLAELHSPTRGHVGTVKVVTEDLEC